MLVRGEALDLVIFLETYIACKVQIRPVPSALHFLKFHTSGA